MPPTGTRSKPLGQAPWLRRYRHLLGRISDAQVAARVGVTPTAVGNVRRRLGIPPARAATPSFDWPDCIIRQLGTVPDRALAEEVGCSPATIRYQRCIRGIEPFSDHQADKAYEWSRDEDAVLGTMPDAAVSRLLGLSEAMVRIRRKALGISPSTAPLDPTPVLPHLGREPDIKLAERFGLSQATIMKWRRARGIPR